MLSVSPTVLHDSEKDRLQPDELLPDGAVWLRDQPVSGMCDTDDTSPNAARLIYHLDGGLKASPRTRSLRKDYNLKQWNDNMADI